MPAMPTPIDHSWDDSRGDLLADFRAGVEAILAEARRPIQILDCPMCGGAFVDGLITRAPSGLGAVLVCGFRCMAKGYGHTDEQIDDFLQGLW